MITDEKRAECRARRADRKAARRKAQQDPFHWTAHRGRPWTPRQVPGSEVIADTMRALDRAYRLAHPIARPPVEPERVKPEEEGAPDNGIISHVECNSAYSRGEGLCHAYGRSPRITGRLSYTQAVNHGMIKES